MRKAWVACAATVVVGLAALIALGASERHTLAFTLGVQSFGPAAILHGGQEACQRPVAVSAAFDEVELHVGTYRRPGPPLELVVRGLGGGAPLARGTLAADYPDNTRPVVAVGHVPSGREVAVCVHNRGPGKIVLYGGPDVAARGSTALLDGKPTGNDIDLVMRTDASHSTLALVSAMLERAALFRAGWIGTWLYWVLMAMVALAVPALVVRAVGAAARTPPPPPLPPRPPSVPLPARARTDASLDDPSAGGRAIRGGAMRITGQLAQLALALAAVPLMVRHLGPEDYGRYVTVSSIVFIITGFTEAGLTSLGVRHYVVMDGAERTHHLRSLAGLRLVLTLGGVLAAVAFTWVTGADSVVVVGTAIVGVGSLLLLTQATYTIPLQAQLRFGALSLIDLAKQAVLTITILLLVFAGAELVPFFWTNVASGAAALLATLVFLRRDSGVLRPAFDLRAWRKVLREVLPYGVAAAVGLIYFRLAVVIMSYVATPYETGIYSTAFRVVEVLTTVPWVAVATGFPILVHAARNDEGRMRYALQRMFEASAIVGVGVALAIALGAQFAIDVIAGPGFEDAVPVLRLLGLALITCFLVATWVFGLLSLGRFRQILIANALAAIVAAAGTLALEPLLGARGAAIATVVGEAVLAAAYVVALARTDRRLLPRFGFVWKVVLAAGIGGLAALLPLHPVAATAIGVAAYTGALFALRAVPVELVHALRRREA